MKVLKRHRVSHCVIQEPIQFYWLSIKVPSKLHQLTKVHFQCDVIDTSVD